VWFFKDLWPGAGWGIIDSLGIPKAAYYYLKRCWQPLHIGITDEGLDGLHLHVRNETAAPFKGFVELMLLKDDHVIVARQEIACDIAPRGQALFESDALLGGFYDVTYAYRFGPPKHDVAISTLYDHQHQVIGEAFHFVQAREPGMLGTVTLEAQAETSADGTYAVALKSDRLLRSVCFDAPGFLPSDNYFHLVPGRDKSVRLRPIGERGGKLKAYVEALNLRDPVRVALRKV
jgi:beta-mannosidase